VIWMAEASGGELVDTVERLSPSAYITRAVQELTEFMDFRCIHASNLRHRRRYTVTVENEGDDITLALRAGDLIELADQGSPAAWEATRP
jgi:hypothetical protein